MIKEKLCGKPHSYSNSFRCIVPVDEQGRHVAYNMYIMGVCVCSCAYKNEEEFYHDELGNTKTNLKK